MASPNDIRLPVRFRAKFQVGESGCWEWDAAITNRGYGTFSWQAHTVLAHRFAYEQLVGPIPNGLTIDHLCRVPVCVNPCHLEAVTIRENVRRGVGWAGRNARKTHCSRGHEFTPENTYLHGPNKSKRHCKTCMAIRKKRRRQP